MTVNKSVAPSPNLTSAEEIKKLNDVIGITINKLGNMAALNLNGDWTQREGKNLFLDITEYLKAHYKIKASDTQPPKVAAPVDANGLKGCPFCGNNVNIIQPTSRSGYRAYCFHCVFQTMHFESQDKLIVYWNTRPDSREPKGMRGASEWVQEIMHPVFIAEEQSTVDPQKGLDELAVTKSENIKIIRAIQRDALQSKGCALPDEPTEEMINATNYENCEPPMARETVINIWNQMRSKCQPLPAAPQLPKD